MAQASTQQALRSMSDKLSNLIVSGVRFLWTRWTLSFTKSWPLGCLGCCWFDWLGGNWDLALVLVCLPHATGSLLSALGVSTLAANG